MIHRINELNEKVQNGELGCSNQECQTRALAYVEKQLKRAETLLPKEGSSFMNIHFRMEVAGVEFLRSNYCSCLLQHANQPCCSSCRNPDPLSFEHIIEQARTPLGFFRPQKMAFQRRKDLKVFRG